MNKNPGSPTYGRVPKSRKEESGEYGLSGPGVVICEDCGAAYYKKSWKHSLDDHKNISEEEDVRFALCLACKMKKDRLFEGQVTIEHIPASIRGDLTGLIENIERRAHKRDPMDRIIVMKSHGKDGLLVRTTENQLAVSIGKQIARAHKGVRMDIQWSNKESVVYVRIHF